MAKNTKEDSVSHSELANALVQAIEYAKPPAKKTVFTRKKDTPWTPPTGTPRAKLKRKSYHHGIEVDTRLSNEEIELLNQLKPGVYCDGFVKVVRRKDKGIDIDYPVKTASHRLRLVNEFGIRDFKELLQRCVMEAARPKKSEDEE